MAKQTSFAISSLYHSDFAVVIASLVLQMIIHPVVLTRTALDFFYWQTMTAILHRIFLSWIISFYRWHSVCRRFRAHVFLTVVSSSWLFSFSRVRISHSHCNLQFRWLLFKSLQTVPVLQIKTATSSSPSRPADYSRPVSSPSAAVKSIIVGCGWPERNRYESSTANPTDVQAKAKTGLYHQKRCSRSHSFSMRTINFIVRIKVFSLQCYLFYARISHFRSDHLHSRFADSSAAAVRSPQANPCLAGTAVTPAVREITAHPLPIKAVRHFRHNVSFFFASL